MEITVFKIRNQRDYDLLFSNSFSIIYLSLNCLVGKGNKDFYLIPLEENHKLSEVIKTTTEVNRRPRVVIMDFVGKFNINLEEELKTTFVTNGYIRIYFTRAISYRGEIKWMNAIEKLVKKL